MVLFGMTVKSYLGAKPQHMFLHIHYTTLHYGMGVFEGVKENGLKSAYLRPMGFYGYDEAMLLNKMRKVMLLKALAKTFF